MSKQCPATCQPLLLETPSLRHALRYLLIPKEFLEPDSANAVYRVVF